MDTYHKLLVTFGLAVCSFAPVAAASKSGTTVAASAMEQHRLNVWNRPIAKQSSNSDIASLKGSTGQRTKDVTLNSVSENNITVPASAAPDVEGQFVLTAYALDKTCTGKSPEMPGFGITASGKRAKPGVTVAVDPRVIAYGSLIYISGIGWRVAQDTGGAIKGHHIDILVNSYEEAVRFGVKQNRYVKIYLPDSKGKETSATPKEVSLINMQN